MGTTVLAARKLNRTHAAISRQIKNLEESLGVQLFERHHGRMTITEAGASYLELTGSALAILERATSDMRRLKKHSKLRVVCHHAFARRWLLPRLTKFRDYRSASEVVLLECRDEAELETIEFDIAVMMGPIHRQHQDCSPLAPEYVFPVRARDPRAESRAEKPLPLILCKDPLAKWDLGFSGKDELLTSNGEVRIDDIDVAISAAVQGHGILLGRGMIIADELAKGSLTPTGNHALQIDTGYWVVRPVGAYPCLSARAFVSFLRTEAIVAIEELKRLSPSLVERRA